MHKTLKIVYIYMLLISLYGCAQPSKKSDIAYLRNRPLDKSITATQIESDLTRTCNMVGVRVSVYPLTGALEHAQNDDIFYKLGLEEHKNDYPIPMEASEKNLVFRVTLSNNGIPSDVDVKYWGFNLLYGDKEYKLSLTTSSEIVSKTHQYSIPMINPGYYDYMGRYMPGITTYSTVSENINICSGTFVLKTIGKNKVDLSKGFKIIVKPRIKRDINPKILEWLVET